MEEHCEKKSETKEQMEARTEEVHTSHVFVRNARSAGSVLETVGSGAEVANRRFQATGQIGSGGLSTVVHFVKRSRWKGGRWQRTELPKIQKDEDLHRRQLSEE